MATTPDPVCEYERLWQPDATPDTGSGTDGSLPEPPELVESFVNAKAMAAEIGLLRGLLKEASDWIAHDQGFPENEREARNLVDRIDEALPEPDEAGGQYAEDPLGGSWS